MVLEKTLESPLDCKEIQPVHSEGAQPWDFFGRNAKAETPVLWPPHVKSWLLGKDSDAERNWGQEEKGMTENAMAGWHRLNGRLSELWKMVMDREAWRAAFHGVTKSRTRLSDWTELNWTCFMSVDLAVLWGCFLLEKTEKEGMGIRLAWAFRSTHFLYKWASNPKLKWSWTAPGLDSVLSCCWAECTCLTPHSHTLSKTCPVEGPSFPSTQRRIILWSRSC